jgi:AcrR family transcriptional regulator
MIFLRLLVKVRLSGGFVYQLVWMWRKNFRMCWYADQMAVTRTDPRPLRADARDNLRRLLEAARDVFIEQGAGAPLDEIARRAGIGIATLYRRFPDRAALIRAVTLDAMRRSAQDARRAAAEEPDPYNALVRYMHGAIDARTAAVIPALLGEIDFSDEEIARAREEGPAAIDPLVDAAKRAGALRADVTAGDIGMLIVRMTRPLPGPLSAEVNNGLSHRHLALLIDGLRPASREPVLPGPALTMDDLRAMPATAATERE